MPCPAVARAILLHGGRETGARLTSGLVFKAAGDVSPSTFRSAGKDIGAYQNTPGGRFFDTTARGRIAFGPGAGLVVGLSVGAETVRATLVDANGWTYYHHESDRMERQLDAEPTVVIDRARAAAAHVLQAAFDEGELLVDGALPLLGWAVAWPEPIDRSRKPVGNILRHHSWRNGRPLDQRLRQHFNVRDVPSYALPDAHAAAIAVAHRLTHDKKHLEWKHPQLTLVLRLAGTVGGGVVVLEPKQESTTHGDTSGFVDSYLLGGVDNHAGQLGHAPVRPTVVDELTDAGINGVGPLESTPCSCVPDGPEASPGHLEQYASVPTILHRLHPDLPRGEALSTILDEPDSDAHHRGLTDVGAVVGDTLLGAVAVLNPAGIVLSGSLTVKAVHDEIERRLDAAHTFGTLPTVDRLTGQENNFARAKGAALALIRNQVHRRLEELLDDEREAVTRNVKALTTPLSENPL